MGLKDGFKLFVASGFFLGLAPVVPGSFGALPALAWHCAALAAGWSDVVVRVWCLVGALAFSAMHYWLTPWAQARWNDSDPRHFVLDEIVGYLCVPVFWVLPSGTSFPAWAFACAGFCAFRVLDAIKLPGARYIDRNVHTASGVLFDDVVSAAYSSILVSAVAWTAA